MTWAHPAYDAIVRLLGARTGLSFGPSRQDAAERGIRQAMERAGITDPEQYRARIEVDPRLFDDLIVELTIGETYFFREPAQFEFIRRTVLPEVRQRRGPGHVVRAWSAACASGEEAYSLAILFEEEGLGARAHLLGTDVSRAALARARAAIYTAWSLRGAAAAAAQPYLHRRGDRWVLDGKIRRRVTFEYLNLALDVYPSFATDTWGMDLILCRNVLIYFDREAIHRVVRRLFESLAVGGWLIAASSDPPLGDEAPFETVVTDVGVFYRRCGARPDSQPDPGPALSTPAPRPIPEVVARVPAPPPALRAPQARTRRPAAPLPPRRSDDREPGGSGVGLAHAAGAAPAVIAEAREAFARGDYARVVELTRGLPTDAAAAALHVRSLANLNTSEAELVCSEAMARHRFSTELHYLHAVLLMALGRDAEAARAMRRVLYLDRSLAVAHFSLGSILRRCGDRAGARRAYRNARDLCAARPPDETVPLSDGEHAGRLAAAAENELAE